MRTRLHSVVLPFDAGEFADDIRRIFLELGRRAGPDAVAGECSPPLDVYETEAAVELAMDLPGVQRDTVRILVKGMAILVVGEKPSRRSRGDSSFHLVERDFGLFARTVRLTVPCDAGRAAATLDQGELRIVLPKVVDRRGRAIAIAIGPS